MKYCPRCKENKENSEFRPHRKRKDGLQVYCAICDKERQNEWYVKNAEKVKAKTIISNTAIRNRNRDIIIKHLKNNPCCKCGETDIVVLEFDHLGNKDCGVSSLMGSSTERLKKEIAKCQILCANCHKRKTAKDFNWYKLEDHLPNVGSGISLQN